MQLLTKFSFLLLTLFAIHTHAANPLGRAAAVAIRATIPQTVAPRVAPPGRPAGMATALLRTTQTNTHPAPRRNISSNSNPPQKVIAAALEDSISPQTILKELTDFFQCADSEGDDNLKFWVVRQAQAEVACLENRLSRIEERLKTSNEHDSTTYDKDHPIMINLKKEKAIITTVIDKIKEEFIDIKY